MTNGRVNAIVRVGNHVYLGGEFTTVGPNTGRGVFLDDRTGAVLPGSPSINGTVFDAVPDGAGGVYVVGDFYAVNGVSRGNGAHIRADGTLGPFDPGADSVIRQIVRVGTRWAIAGEFLSVKGVERVRLAIIDGTGAPTSWRADVNGSVHALAVSPDGTRLFVGGTYGQIDGEVRRNVASVNVTTGVVDTWAPPTNSTVYAIAVSPNATRVYLGGTFTTVGVLPRQRVAVVDYGTGIVDPVWQANVDGAVFALAVNAADQLYIGGRFGKLKNVGRLNAGAVDASGAVLPWNPWATDAVYDITFAAGNTAWLTGMFTSVRFVQRMFLARVDLNGGELASTVDPFASGPSRLALPLSGGRLFFGGEFTSVNVTKRQYLARLNATTGELDPTFLPTLDGPVNTLDVSEDGSTLYIGGRFTLVNGVARRLAAALWLPAGNVTSFDPNVEGYEVLAIDQRGTKVFIGGQFNRIGGVPLANVARVEAQNGDVNLVFAPNPNAAVRDVDATPDGGAILGGDFTRLGVVNMRSYLVHVGPNGGVQPWAPDVPSFVTEGVLSADGSTYYAALIGPGGRGNAVEAYSRGPDATRLWRTEGDGDVQAIALAPDGETIYAGGHFFRIFATGTSDVIALRNRAMALSTSNGALREWAPVLDFNGVGVFSILATADELYLGGEFMRIGSASTQGVAFFPGVP